MSVDKYAMAYASYRQLELLDESLDEESLDEPEELEELDELALGCWVRRRERERDERVRDERVRGGDCGGRPKVGNSKFLPKRPPSRKYPMMPARR